MYIFYLFDFFLFSVLEKRERKYGIALRAGVKNKSLKQSKGTGASGSFKIGEVVKPKKKPRKSTL
jgi:DNA polymerase elongation subunit (family B)